MHIALVINARIPVFEYGGTERIVWSLARSLIRRGHKVTLMALPGSTCDFTRILPVDFGKSVDPQLPSDIDVAHLFAMVNEPISKPHIIRTGYNHTADEEFPLNTVFVSKDHARRYGSDRYVYNGLDWDSYGAPSLTGQKRYFHFLADASWRVKNVKGAIQVILKTPAERLEVLGGTRLNFRMGFRFTATRRAHFNGMVGGKVKLDLIRNSKGLLFPVLWHEPFGIAMIESLYLGCPVFGTPYGSLPEIITPDVGVLSSRSDELADAVMRVDAFSRKRCHEYARERFNAEVMTDNYLALYDEVLSGRELNAKPPKLQEPQTEKFLPWE